MTLFRDTDKGAAFIAKGKRRNTSPEVMRAIAHYAVNAKDAETIWNGRLDGDMDIWWRAVVRMAVVRMASDNGRLQMANLYWGNRTLIQLIENGGEA